MKSPKSLQWYSCLLFRGASNQLSIHCNPDGPVTETFELWKSGLFLNIEYVERHGIELFLRV